MIRRPPRSTPCPYTTLFRSRRELRAGCQHAHHGARPVVHDELLADRRRVAGETPHPETVADHDNGDRKSTRLNSSHANISYAVFCLKKTYSPWSASTRRPIQ